MARSQPPNRLIGYVTWDSVYCAELWTGGEWRVTIGGVEKPLEDVAVFPPLPPSDPDVAS